MLSGLEAQAAIKKPATVAETATFITVFLKKREKQDYAGIWGKFKCCLLNDDVNFHSNGMSLAASRFGAGQQAIGGDSLDGNEAGHVSGKSAPRGLA
jgi:hypothetical protein